MKVRLIQMGGGWSELRGCLEELGHEVTDDNPDLVLLVATRASKSTLKVISTLEHVVVFDYGEKKGEKARCRAFFRAGANDVADGPKNKISLSRMLNLLS
jgi:hypothetical protein